MFLGYNPSVKELFLPLISVYRDTARLPQAALMLTMFQGLLENFEKWWKIKLWETLASSS